MERYKYPRTYHFPFSPGVGDDDKQLSDTSHFNQMYVVVTEKMDGENTTIYRDKCYARSLDSVHKPYHSYLYGSILPTFQYRIPEGWRVCGEYLYAKHSIEYKNLISYFLCFSVWDADNKALSWKDTKEFCNKLGICLVPELYVGLYDEERIKRIAESVVDRGGEGIVVRNAGSFSYSSFGLNVAKYVRKGHVQTDEHWSQQVIVLNGLRK